MDISEQGKIKRTFRGRVYASRAECEYAKLLDLQLRDPAGIVIEVVPQPIVQLGEDTTYKPDFLVITNRYGLSAVACYYVDVKGKETKEFRRCKKLWAKYGRLPLLVVKRERNGNFTTTETVENDKLPASKTRP